jgi:predicted PurR-regulated permease PerM
MSLTETDIKKLSLIFFIVLLAVLVFLVVRPVLMTVLGGLILAYIFLPVHRWITKQVKNKTLSAAIVSALVLIIIIAPLWFLASTMIKQVFNLYQFSQNWDVYGLVNTIVPQSAGEEIISQISLGLTNAISTSTSAILNWIVDFLLNFPIILLHLLLVAFVFFFALKEEEELRKFASGISPLKKTEEEKLVKQFKDMTKAIIYGQIILGLIQGIFAGIGFLVFGIPNALVLTVIATILSIIPVIGPSLVYFPVTIYLLIIGQPFLAIGYLLYNLLIVSTIDNFLRAHLVSRKTKVSSVIVLIGMIGGIFIFGVLGLILGPLILAYFITFLKAYRDKTLSSMFTS